MLAAEAKGVETVVLEVEVVARAEEVAVVELEVVFLVGEDEDRVADAVFVTCPIIVIIEGCPESLAWHTPSFWHLTCKRNDIEILRTIDSSQFVVSAKINVV